MNGPVQPLRQIVLKVHSRCDLACDHCYVYQHQDQGWRGQPMVMSAETVAWTGHRIAEHAKAHALDEVRVILHGGEPLLAGVAHLRATAQALRAALRGVCALDLRIHTNGVRLDDAFLRMFAEQDIKVGVSVDGDRSANDRHRRFADGRGSYDHVLAAIGLLRARPYRHLYAGLLCTVDVANDPLAVYESLLALGPTQIEFLLPHATWDHPPQRSREAEYADWLIAIYDHWSATGQPVRIRLFDSIVATSLGGSSLTEAIGLTPSDLVVVETDGTYEQADSLKTAFDGAPFTGLDIIRHDLDEVARHPGLIARQQGLAGLCDTCRACPVVTSCGGGLYAHRYRSGTAFANPSVYCADLLKLVTHVRNRLAAQPGSGHAPGSAHAIPGPDFEALAAGFGGASAIGYLIDSQRSLRRALVAAVYEEAAASPALTGPQATAFTQAWGLLTDIDQGQPKAVDTVLGHPFVRVWAARCLARLSGSASGNPEPHPVSADLGHLAGIAAATAIRAGVPARVTVPLREGAAHLPTLGRFTAGESGAPAVMVEVADDFFTLASGTGRWMVPAAAAEAGTRSGDPIPGCWQPVRSLTAPGLSVSLEDTDPYRYCYDWPPAERADDEELAHWGRLFNQAWALIREQYAAYADGLAAGLTTIMPMSPGPADRDTSATARHAFGAVGAARPADHASLALLLLHEFQHVKLGAILDLYDLLDQGDQRLFKVRWRPDPRPLPGILQGTYAHIAVVDFWRERRHTASGPAAAVADRQFAYWREGTAEAIDILTGSGSLTPLGQRFVDGMCTSLAPWLDEQVRALGSLS